MAQRPPTHADLGSLLSYLADYRVVVCLECRYAVQPAALSSHLRKHKIFRGKRQELLDLLGRCELDAPEQVVDPPPTSPAIPGIPVYHGYKCLAPDCPYLCVARKRITQHWSQNHGLSSERPLQTRRAKIQTFFRGTRLRYFEVQSSAETTDTPSLAEGYSERAETETSDQLPQDDVLSDSGGPWSALDVDALMYMHHFTVYTAQTVTLGKGDPAYVSHQLPQEASNREYLLYAILGTAACHKAFLAAADTAERAKHKIAGLRYQSMGIAAYRRAIDGADSDDAVALAATSRFLGLQDNVLSCMYSESSVWGAQSADDASKALTRYLVLLQGCGNILLKFHEHFPPDCGMRLCPDSLGDLQFLDTHNGLNANGMPVLYQPSSDALNMPPHVLRSLQVLPERLRGASGISDDDIFLAVQSCGVLLQAISRALALGAPYEWKLWAASLGFVISPVVRERLLPALQRKDPVAFVVLAMFGRCVTCGLSDSLWFTVGQIDRYLKWCRAGLVGHERLLGLVDGMTLNECEIHPG